MATKNKFETITSLEYNPFLLVMISRIIDYNAHFSWRQRGIIYFDFTAWEDDETTRIAIWKNKTI